jgi:hypothetical protein
MVVNPALAHARLVEYIIQFVGEYYEVHGEGVMGRAVSIRYARRLKPFGGFQDTMVELVKCGVLRAVMKKSGGYLYYPQDAEISEVEGGLVLTG